MNVDSTGNSFVSWWNNLGNGWKIAIGIGVIVAMGALTVITAGGFAAAGTALLSVVSSTMAPTALSAVIGGAWGGAHYALQKTGHMAVKASLKSIVNNPLDEFVALGPKSGQVENYVRSISQTGEYGQIFVTKLANGMLQIANGHHRIAALIALGYEFVKVYLTK